MNLRKLLVAALLAAVIAAFFVLDAGQYLRLEYFRSQQAAIDAVLHAHPLQTAAAYFVLYVVATSVSLPVAAVMTLAGGAIFGLAWGTLIVSFASSIGATLAFLASRFLFRDAVRARFGDRLRAVNAGVEREGAFYLFALRLVPAFPFFVINLVMALTPLRTWTFYWVSQLGMFTSTVVFVNAGTQIAQIDASAGILSPSLVASFVLLGLLPLAARRMVGAARARKALARWPRP
jgi:uncharacterized membrane protein YdjX (TVP38/TMEM64 family)